MAIACGISLLSWRKIRPVASVSSSCRRFGLLLATLIQLLAGSGETAHPEDVIMISVGIYGEFDPAFVANAIGLYLSTTWAVSKLPRQQ